MTSRHTTLGSPLARRASGAPPALLAPSASPSTPAPAPKSESSAPRAYGEMTARSSAPRAHGEPCGGIASRRGSPSSGDMGSRTGSECVTQHLRRTGPTNAKLREARREHRDDADRDGDADDHDLRQVDERMWRQRRVDVEAARERV